MSTCRRARTHHVVVQQATRPAPETLATVHLRGPHCKQRRSLSWSCARTLAPREYTHTLRSRSSEGIGVNAILRTPPAAALATALATATSLAAARLIGVVIVALARVVRQSVRCGRRRFGGDRRGQLHGRRRDWRWRADYSGRRSLSQRARLATTLAVLRPGTIGAVALAAAPTALAAAPLALPTEKPRAIL